MTPEPSLLTSTRISCSLYMMPMPVMYTVALSGPAFTILAPTCTVQAVWQLPCGSIMVILCPDETSVCYTSSTDA